MSKLVMVAKFVSNVRTGPTASHLKPALDIREDFFNNLGERRTPLGHMRIEGDELIIYNSSTDPRTKEPIVVHVRLSGVVYYEPLSPKMREELYPNGIPGLEAPKAERKPAKDLPLA